LNFHICARGFAKAAMVGVCLSSGSASASLVDQNDPTFDIWGPVEASVWNLDEGGYSTRWARISRYASPSAFLLGDGPEPLTNAKAKMPLPLTATLAFVSTPGSGGLMGGGLLSVAGLLAWKSRKKAAPKGRA